MGDRQAHSSLLADARVRLSASRRGSIDIGQGEDQVGFGNAAEELLVALVAHDRQAFAIVIGEAVFDVQEAVELRESFRLKTRELARAQELAEKHRRLI